MQTRVKVFKGSINVIENTINTWAEENGVQIVSTSLAYDTNGSIPGGVFVIVVYRWYASADA